MKNFLLNILLAALLISPVKFFADEPPKPEVGINERLGETLPDGLMFFDENGLPVSLKSLVNKPTIFNLVYFRCPGICSPLLNGLTKTIDNLDMQAGKDYDVITISFDPTENYLIAKEKKENYLNTLKKKKIPHDSWRFLTGDSANIKKIADALGFKYMPQGADFMHGASLMVVSKDGKITRYLYGVDFLPLDMKLSVIEATEGRVGTTINKLLKMCYSYDPDGRRYVLSVTRIAGGATIIMLAAFFMVLLINKKKKTNVPDINQERNITND